MVIWLPAQCRVIEHVCREDAFGIFPPALKGSRHYLAHLLTAGPFTIWDLRLYHILGTSFLLTIPPPPHTHTQTQTFTDCPPILILEKNHPQGIKWGFGINGQNPPNGIWKPRLAGKFWARYPSFKTTVVTLDDWSDQGSPMLHPFDLLAPSDFALWLNTRRARWRYDSAEMCEYHARVNTRILFRCLRCVNTVFGSHGHSYESHGGANWRPPTPAGPRA